MNFTDVAVLNITPVYFIGVETPNLFIEVISMFDM